MKLCVLVPGEAYRRNAGARIRYGRLTDALAARQVELELIDIGQYDPATSNADVLLISKCHDARAQLIAMDASRRGVRVGVDLFDDYFSQTHDPRLTRFRRWLTQLAPFLSFALTSTKAMAEVAAVYLPDISVHVVNDPAPTDERGEMIIASADEIAARRRRALDEGQLRVAWFGIGDNPYFPVGLSDLAFHAGELATLARLSGLAVNLTILTNSRALTADGMAFLASLPVPFVVKEWSEEAEAALVRDSFACFLPVSAQTFSAAKSLNRAITALTAGCQILSAGYPLYATLDAFLYRDARKLALDLEADELRVSPVRRDELIRLLSKWADVDSESQSLIEFLENLPTPSQLPLGEVALIHGASTTDAVNKLARALGDMTVGSPYAPSNLAVDVRAVARVPLAIELLERDSSFRQKRADTPTSEALLDLSQCGLAVQLALHGAVIAAIGECLSVDVGINHSIVSENSTLPFSAVC